jgi:exonuclease III
MHIMTWNIGRRRALPLLQPLLAAHSPTIVMLQEASLPVDWHDRHTGAAVPGYEWGSCVLASAGRLDPVSFTEYEGWLSGAIWSDGPARIAVFSLHSPTGTGRSYIEESAQMVSLVSTAVDNDLPVVIGGDFNFTSFGERAADEPIRTTKEEREALQRFEALGFSLGWRSAHKDGPLPQTLRWSGNRVTPYHCDGFLVRGHAIAACDVLRTADLGFPSDHEPVLLELAPKGAA